MGLNRRSSLFELLKWWPALAGFLLILLLAGAVMPYPGLEEDEVLFATPLFQHGVSYFGVRLGSIHIPLMHMSYLGAWKTWIYAAIFKYWTPSVASVRWPPTVVCAFTVCIFFHLLRLVHGWRAAAIGSLLLATDSVFVLTAVFDWGPVVFQHLFLVSILALSVQYYHSGSLRVLGCAAFLAGMGLWDKALFLWPFGGICIAALILWSRMFRPTRYKVLTVVLGFCIGASPFLLFNVKRHWETFRTNGKFTFSEFYVKYWELRRTADGSVLFGYMANEENAPHPRPAENRVERWSEAVHGVAGTWRNNWMIPAWCTALLLLPFLWRTPARKPMLFALIATGVGWFQMAITENAGGSAHHVILLWPLPELFIALAFAEASRLFKRPGAWVAGAATLVLITTNLLNFNQFLYQIARYGTVRQWTDGAYSLSIGARKFPAGTPLLVADWGILNGLRVLHDGTLNLNSVSQLFQTEHPNEAQQAEAKRLFAQSDAVWLRFVDGREMFPGINARMEKMAQQAGYKRIPVGLFHDRNDRPVIEAFRLER